MLPLTVSLSVILDKILSVREEEFSDTRDG